MTDVATMARAAKKASIQLAAVESNVKNQALENMAAALEAHRQEIFSANEKDMKLGSEAGLSDSVLKRLRFDEKKLLDVLAGLRSLQHLPEPVGRTLSCMQLDEGLELYKVSCPIGVIGVVFESRPDALVQISSLCLKSGNAVLLKGGREALNTNRALAEIIRKSTEGRKIPENWMQLLETRTDVAEMLKMDQWIDLLIPRGSNQFVQYIMHNTSIPVLGHADGICHVYVDQDADISRAVAVAADSKTQYVSVCNACETLLVHEKIAGFFLPRLKEVLDGKGVRLIGCEKTGRIIPVETATEEDWRTEYLDYVLSIRVVSDENQALEHINTYGSGHTEVIVSENPDAVRRFMALADSGNVFWNCSSRFSDGFRYGLGAEVGISTNKIHARGPVGLEGLTIYKWLMKGSGQIVADYAEGRKHFTHVPLQKDFSI